MKELSSQASAILERYRGVESLREIEKARLQGTLGRRAARGDMPRYGLGVPFPGHVRPLGALERFWNAPLAKGIAGLACAGAIVAGIAATRASSPGVSAVPAIAGGLVTPCAVSPPLAAAADPIAAEPAVGEPMVATPVVVPSSPPSKPKARAARPAVDSHDKAPSADAPSTRAGEATVDEEVRLLRDAQNALKSDDSRRALEILGEHASRFPSGKLSDAREVTRLVVLCKTGEYAAARAGADEFLARHPGSPFSDRVRRICSAAAEMP